jgi:N-acetylneuraminic acid mutarotase
MHHPPRLFWPLVRRCIAPIVLGFAVILGMFLISGNDQAFAQGGVWVTKTPMPAARSSVMVAGIEGKLYVAGGNISCCDFNFLDTLEVYDPVTEAWTIKAPMHQVRSAGGSAVIGNKLYAVGGRIPGIDVATLEVYDPATNTWTTKTPMSTPRRWPAVEAIDGLLYVAGGTQEGPGPGSLSILEVYDPATDTWTTKASLPVPRDSMASGVIDGKLYLAGGETNNEIFATLLVYDPATDTWAEKTPMPTARVFPAGAVLNGQLYVVTGIADFVSPPLRTVEAYDPVADTWKAAAPIPTGRDRLGEVGVIAGKLYVAGGWNPCFACDIATLEVFEPTADSDDDSVLDDEDECPDSDLSATIVIDGCNAGVPNTLFPNGCTISDLIAACAEDASSHGQSVSCVSHVTNDLHKAGTISGQQKGAIQSCAAQANIP